MGNEVWQMKRLNFLIERNNAFDLIKNFKLLVKNYDDPKHRGRYISMPMVSNGEYIINIVIERKKKCVTTEPKQ